MDFGPWKHLWGERKAFFSMGHRVATYRLPYIMFFLIPLVTVTFIVSELLSIIQSQTGEDRRPLREPYNAWLHLCMNSAFIKCWFRSTYTITKTAFIGSTNRCVRLLYTFTESLVNTSYDGDTWGWGWAQCSLPDFLGSPRQVAASHSHSPHCSLSSGRTVQAAPKWS